MSIVESAAHRAPRYSKEFDPQTCMVDPEHPITYSDIEEHRLAHDAIEKYVTGQSMRERNGSISPEAAERARKRDIGLAACAALVDLYMARGGELTPMPKASDIDDMTPPSNLLDHSNVFQHPSSAYLPKRWAS